MARQQSILEIAKAPSIAYSKKDWDAMSAALSPEIVYDEVATKRKTQGIKDIVALWRGWATAFPDSIATFQHELVSGNTVVLELTWRGTHTGPLQTGKGEIPPTGRKFELRSCQIIEIAGDKPKSMRQYFDMATLLQQLGVS